MRKKNAGARKKRTKAIAIAMPTAVLLLFKCQDFFYFVIRVSTSSSISLWFMPTRWPSNFTLFPQTRA